MQKEAYGFFGQRQAKIIIIKYRGREPRAVISYFLRIAGNEK